MATKEYKSFSLEHNEEDEIKLTGLVPFSDEDPLEPLKFHDEYHDDEDETDGSPADATDQETMPLSLTKELSLQNVWNRWEEPCLPSCAISLLSVPVLILMICSVYHFTARLWAAWIFVFHLQLRLGISQWYISNVMTVKLLRRKVLRFTSSVVSIIDILFFGVVYPLVPYIVTRAVFLEPDGTINMDWTSEVRFMRILTGLSFVIAILRLGVSLRTLLARYREQVDATFWIPYSQDNTSTSISKTAQRRLYRTFEALSLTVFVFHLSCILSIIVHFGPSPSDSVIPSMHCDPMDRTLCALPFPSFHHMKKDDDTATGWRVDLKGLPPLRGGLPLHPEFLNDLDGFSTQAPILFYMNGLKEAHEQYSSGGLQGPERIEYSVTAKSITLLLNVDEKTLVHHRYVRMVSVILIEFMGHSLLGNILLLFFSFYNKISRVAHVARKLTIWIQKNHLFWLSLPNP